MRPRTAPATPRCRSAWRTATSTMLASGLAAPGHGTGCEALTSSLLGNAIVTRPILLNSHPGCRSQHSRFHAFARRVAAIAGSNHSRPHARDRRAAELGIRRGSVREALRGRFFAVLVPNWTQPARPGFAGPHRLFEWLGCSAGAGFIGIIYKGMNLLRRSGESSAPAMLVVTAVLLGNHVGGEAARQDRPLLSGRQVRHDRRVLCRCSSRRGRAAAVRFPGATLC